VALTRRLADPGAREVWRHNRAVMTMRRDADLGLDLDAGVGCLPLVEPAVRRTFTMVELHVPSAVRALTGAITPSPSAADVDASWRPPRQRSVRFPAAARHAATRVRPGDPVLSGALSGVPTGAQAPAATRMPSVAKPRSRPPRMHQVVSCFMALRRATASSSMTT
jgi:hypothetical protein